MIKFIKGMKITVNQWIEIIKLLSTFLIGVLTTLTMQSCSASMSIFWKNSNKQSEQKAEQSASTRADSLTIKPIFK